MQSECPKAQAEVTSIERVVEGVFQLKKILHQSKIKDKD
jgi:hypothetical protein